MATIDGDHPSPAIAGHDRFWFEYPSDDLPFYNGRPARISGLKWLVMMAASVLGFLALIASPPTWRHGPAALVPAVLFFAIPLAGLAIVAPRGWTALFRKVGPRDVLWMAGFALLNMLVTMLIGYLVMQVSATTANAAIGDLPTLSASERAFFLLKTLPQLFGEEVMTILPFLAVLTILSQRAGASRKWAIVGAWIASAALFGAAHLPTYGWNLVQCFVIIGSARLILTLPYVMTKNIWVSTGAHVINDWSFFGVTLLGAALGHR